MEQVSIRELRNRGGDVVDRVATGEPVTITRDGVPVAELRAVTQRALSAAMILERWRRLPQVDPLAFRRDIDSAIDATL
ncbi:MAG: hypothetical protein NVS3B24_17930 [Candidatus Dormibacteria bacterium]